MREGWLSRRGAIGCGAAAACLAPSSPALAARAGFSCTPPNRSGYQVCTVGLELAPFFETVRQKQNEWCWAACIHTIFRFHGYQVAQERIVQKVFGRPVDSPATDPQIIRAIDGYWYGDHGARFFARGVVLWNEPSFFRRSEAVTRAVQDLHGGNPLIIASEGHATVLTSITYTRGSLGRLAAINSLRVRDPWPFSQNHRELRHDEVLRSGFLCSVRVSPAAA